MLIYVAPRCYWKSEKFVWCGKSSSHVVSVLLQVYQDAKYMDVRCK